MRNLRQALTSLVSGGKRLLRNVFLDFRYGAFLGGARKTRYAHLGIADTASTDYAAFPFIFGDAIQNFDVLVDIGCGKGRVINWWLNRGLRNEMIGIELDETIAKKTRRRLQRYKNVKIICGDALDHLPENGTLFYLYNPFNKPWVAALKARLEVLFTHRAARMIFYYNCVHVDVFKNDPNWIVEETELAQPFHRLAVVRRRTDNAFLQHDSDLPSRGEKSWPVHREHDHLQKSRLTHRRTLV